MQGDSIDSFSTDSMKRSILDIQNEAVNQQLVLLSLKQKRIDLENDIKRKVVELKQAKEEQHLLEDQLQGSELRLIELQKHSTETEGHIANLRHNAQDVINCCNKEKSIQLVLLRDYETNMADLSQKVSAGPKSYNKDTLMAELTQLKTERASIHDELKSIEKDMNGLRTQLAILMSRNTEFTTCSDSLVDLSRALKFILNESRVCLCEGENKRLEQEIKSLQQIATELRAETKGRNN